MAQAYGGRPVRRTGSSLAKPLVLLLLLGLTAGCGGGPTDAGTPPAGTSSTGTPATAGAGSATADPAGVGGPAQAAGGSPPAAVPAALDFTARTLDGRPFHGADLAGRPVVLWFWAPWCATCAGQAPSVAEMAAAHGGRVTVVGVAGLGAAPAMRDFVTEFDLGGVPQLDDRAGEIWRRFRVTEQSTFVILDGAGGEVHRGWLDSVRFEQQVARLAG